MDYIPSIAIDMDETIADPITKAREWYYRDYGRVFSEEELVDLTMATIAINSYNRLNAAFLPVAGGYKPGMFATQAN